MSVKLSELLDLAGEALDENAVRSCAKALRAIAPALVEAAEFITRQHSPPRKFPYCDCAGCVLTHEMEKAGVTCE